MECIKCEKEISVAKLGAVGKYCLKCWKELMLQVGMHENEGQTVRELPNGIIIHIDLVKDMKRILG